MARAGAVERKTCHAPALEFYYMAGLAAHENTHGGSSSPLACLGEEPDEDIQAAFLPSTTSVRRSSSRRGPMGGPLSKSFEIS